MTFKPNYFGGPPGQYDAESDEYGEDLLFDDGDLQVPSDGDYSTITGVENYRRSLIRRIITRPGEYRMRPDYGAGLASYVKRVLTTSVRGELEKRITAQVAKDRRTKKVISVSLTEEEFNSVPYIKVSVVVEALGGRITLRPFMVSRAT